MDKPIIGGGSEFTSVTLDHVRVRYATANERLITELEQRLERLTRDGKPCRILIEFDGSRFHLWEGVRAGVI